MTVQDYRIGNFCLKEEFPGEGKQVWTINAGDLYDHCQDGKPLPEPIPLTPEWLERLGFIKQPTEQYNDYWKGGKFSSGRSSSFLLRESPVKSYGYLPLEYKDVHAPIKYVHQLQNFYHALTGQELTIKEKV